MGAYTHLKGDGTNGTLAPKPDDDPKRQDRLNVVKDRIRAAFVERNEELSVGARVELLDGLEEALDVANAEVKRLEDERDAVKQLIMDEFTRLKLSSVRAASGSLFIAEDVPAPVVTDRGKVIDWAKEKMPDILTVNTNTLKAIAKKAVTDGEELPDGVDVYMASTIRRRKGKA